MNRNPDPHIYFIRPVGAEGPIKVGHTIHAEHRLHELMKWSPVPLEIAARLPIPEALDKWGSILGVCSRFERRFHLRYREYRMHKEWFAAHPLILADIDNINAGTFDLDCLPEWKRASNAFIRRTYSSSLATSQCPATGSRAAVSREPTLSTL